MMEKSTVARMFLSSSVSIRRLLKTINDLIRHVSFVDMFSHQGRSENSTVTADVQKNDSGIHSVEEVPVALNTDANCDEMKTFPQ